MSMEILHAYKCDSCSTKEIVAAEADSTGLPPTWLVVNKGKLRAGKTRGAAGHPEGTDRALVCGLPCAESILYDVSLNTFNEMEKHIEGLRKEHSKPETNQPEPVAASEHYPKYPDAMCGIDCQGGCNRGYRTEDECRSQRGPNEAELALAIDDDEPF
jgi:hypothetical protein